MLAEITHAAWSSLKTVDMPISRQAEKLAQEAHLNALWNSPANVHTGRKTVAELHYTDASEGRQEP